MKGYGFGDRFKMGDMRERITFQYPVNTFDSEHQPIITYTDSLSNVPAKVEYANGTERLRGKQVTEDVEAVFTIRYIASINTTLRIKHTDPSGTNYYGIIRARPLVGSRHFMEIHAKQEP